MSEKVKEDKIFQGIQKQVNQLSPAYKIKLIRIVLTPEIEHEIKTRGKPHVQKHLALLQRLWAKNDDIDPKKSEKIIQESIQAVRSQ